MNPIRLMQWQIAVATTSFPLFSSGFLIHYRRRASTRHLESGVLPREGCDTINHFDDIAIKSSRRPTGKIYDWTTELNDCHDALSKNQRKHLYPNLQRRSVILFLFRTLSSLLWASLSCVATASANDHTSLPATLAPSTNKSASEEPEECQNGAIVSGTSFCVAYLASAPVFAFLTS